LITGRLSDRFFGLIARTFATRRAVLSVSRHGQRIEQKVGSEAAKGFVCRHLYNRDFLLLSRMDDTSIPSIKRAPIPFAK